MQLTKYAILLVAILGLVGLAAAGKDKEPRPCSEFKNDQFKCKSCCSQYGLDMRAFVQALAMGCYCKDSKNLRYQ